MCRRLGGNSYLSVEEAEDERDEDALQREAGTSAAVSGKPGTSAGNQVPAQQSGQQSTYKRAPVHGDPWLSCFFEADPHARVSPDENRAPVH